MALRPPIISLKCPRPETTTELADEPPAAAGERIRRPVLAREGPDRRSSPLDAHDETSSPIPNAVTNAYRVFDRYLDEGKSYAQGESAWFRGSSASPTALVPRDRATIDGLVKIADQFARVSALLQAVLPESCPIAKALRAYDARGTDDDVAKWARWFSGPSSDQAARTDTIRAPEPRWRADDLAARS